MSQSRSPSRLASISDDYPRRPSIILKNEIHQLNFKIEKNETYTLGLLLLTYFIYGAGIGIYGPLYPQQARAHGVTIYVYGPVITINFLISILFYPVASLMATSITCKQSISMGIFMIGVCRLLFGTVALISSRLPFISLSYSIQIVEGIGFSILLAATYVSVFSEITEKTPRNVAITQVIFILGISIGSLCAEAVNQVYGFSVSFYGVGVLAVLNAIIVAAILPEPDPKITHQEMSFLSWTRKPRMLIYFLIVFTTFNYIGFLTVVLEPYVKQFHLNKIFIGALFSIAPFSCGLSAPGWKWISKKGLNSLFLVGFSSILIITSLILIGPVPFIIKDSTLSNLSTALLLCGLGSGGKLACTTYAARRDLRTEAGLNAVHPPLLIPTMLLCGSLFGYFTGSVAAGFSCFYLAMGKATYSLLGLEALTIGITLVFAFKRNYRSPLHPGAAEEQEPILRN